ncbi:hypothetical protein [Photobacterium leiognathi]|uniref:hypothetical protein n=1 Tax=Photobacterium leiognathi TaxID=553611 RepID=UPI002981BAD6|nr:hypothetical protein [Photobacterium leiognathi]
MKYLFLVIFLMTTGCGGNDEKNDSADNPKTTPTTPPPNTDIPDDSVCEVIDGNNEICLQTYTGESGERIKVKIHGDIPEGSTITWSAKSPSEIPTPILFDGIIGEAFLVLPVVEKETEIELIFEITTDTETAVVTSSLKVNPIDDDVIFPGINFVMLNPEKKLEIEWEHATKTNGEPLPSTNYEIKLIRLDNGVETNDQIDFFTTDNKLEVDVLLDTEYRIIVALRLDSGDVFYSDHIDYHVPLSKPVLKKVFSSSEFDAELIHNYPENQLFKIDGKLKIVRTTDNVEKYLDDAHKYEVFETWAPLDIKIRTKSSSFTFTDALDSNTPSTFNSSGGKHCIESGTSKWLANAKGSICISKFSFSCDYGLSLSPKIKVTHDCKLSISNENKLEFANKLAIGPIIAPLPASKGINLKWLNLKVQPNLGIAFDIATPFYGEVGFGIENTIKSEVRFETNTHSEPSLSAAIKNKNDKTIVPLYGNEYYKVYEHTRGETRLNLEAKIGLFPKITISDQVDVSAELVGKAEIKAKAVRPYQLDNLKSARVKEYSLKDGEFKISGAAMVKMSGSRINNNNIPPLGRSYETAGNVFKFSPDDTFIFSYKRNYNCEPNLTFNRISYDNEGKPFNVIVGPENYYGIPLGTLKNGQKYAKKITMFDEYNFQPTGDLKLTFDSFYKTEGAPLKFTPIKSGDYITGSKFEFTDGHNSDYEAIVVYRLIDPNSNYNWLFNMYAYQIYSIDRYTSPYIDSVGNPFNGICWGSTINNATEGSSEWLPKYPFIGNAVSSHEFN